MLFFSTKLNIGLTQITIRVILLKKYINDC